MEEEKEGREERTRVGKKEKEVARIGDRILGPTTCANNRVLRKLSFTVIVEDILKDIHAIHKLLPEKGGGKGRGGGEERRKSNDNRDQVRRKLLQEENRDIQAGAGRKGVCGFNNVRSA